MVKVGNPRIKLQVLLFISKLEHVQTMFLDESDEVDQLHQFQMFSFHSGVQVRYNLCFLMKGLMKLQWNFFFIFFVCCVGTVSLCTFVSCCKPKDTTSLGKESFVQTRRCYHSLW